MADILLSGMEMPKNCCECPFSVYEDVCVFTGVVALSIGRQGACPLVELPPHGDLIDRDALFAEMQNAGWYVNADRDEVAEKLLEQARTIVPAEGGQANGKTG